MIFEELEKNKILESSQSDEKTFQPGWFDIRSCDLKQTNPKNSLLLLLNSIKMVSPFSRFFEYFFLFFDISGTQIVEWNISYTRIFICVLQIFINKSKQRHEIEKPIQTYNLFLFTMTLNSFWFSEYVIINWFAPSGQTWLLTRITNRNNWTLWAAWIWMTNIHFPSIF